MELNSLTAISPIDGRYRKLVEPMAHNFSEFGLMKYRVMVEVEYFIALCELPLPQLVSFDKSNYPVLREAYLKFDDFEALKIKEIEHETNHDMKAVEYYLKSKFEDFELSNFAEFIHFGLTSQDINNTSIPLLLKDAMEKFFMPKLQEVITSIKAYAVEWQDLAMLARTHGQPASPTKLGKEFQVFVERLEKQVAQLGQIEYSAKFGGATGNFNAHHVAYPQVDWVQFANNFVNNILKLSRSQYTTQIEHYDNLAAMFDCIKRINTILIDFDRDVWQYISMDYFKQKINKGEIGSSAMPHKVNPIDFENSEGNLGFANAIFEFLSAKLPVSRLQRDLTDSTVLRNLGMPIAHSYLAYVSLIRGLKKLELNIAAINADLDNNWAVVAEAIQTVLRRENFPKPYEALKELTRTNTKIDEAAIKNFIETLEISETVKAELRLITPFTYTGVKF